MTTITTYHDKYLEFALIKLDRRWHELAEAAREVCREAPPTEATARLRALVGMNEINSPEVDSALARQGRAW